MSWVWNVGFQLRQWDEDVGWVGGGEGGMGNTSCLILVLLKESVRTAFCVSA